MKHFIFALISLGFSLPLLAAPTKLNLSPPLATTAVTIPTMPGGLSLGVITVGGNFGSSKSLGTTWGWGINANYIFPQTANDLSINYLHLRSK